MDFYFQQYYLKAEPILNVRLLEKLAVPSRISDVMRNKYIPKKDKIKQIAIASK